MPRRRSSSGRSTVTRPRSSLIAPSAAKRLRARLTFSRLAPTRPASVRCDSGTVTTPPGRSPRAGRVGDQKSDQRPAVQNKTLGLDKSLRVGASHGVFLEDGKFAEDVAGAEHREDHLTTGLGRP